MIRWMGVLNGGSVERAVILKIVICVDFTEKIESEQKPEGVWEYLGKSFPDRVQKSVQKSQCKSQCKKDEIIPGEFREHQGGQYI